MASSFHFSPYPHETVQQAVVKKQLKNEKEKERRDREAELVGELRRLVAQIDQDFMQTSKLEKMDVLRGAKELIEKQHREISNLKVALRQSYALLQQQNLFSEYHLYWQNLKKQSSKEKDEKQNPKSKTPEPNENSLCESNIGTPSLDASTSSEESSSFDTGRQSKVWRGW